MLFPDRVERALIIGVAPLSAMGLALNHLQRQAIQGDPDWNGGNYLPHKQPRYGLALARQIAMISYKSASLLDGTVWREIPTATEKIHGASTSKAEASIGGRFDIAGYLDLQGRRFVERFDANAYLAILRTMDTWDPLHGQPSPDQAFGRIQAHLSFRWHQFRLAVSARVSARLCRCHSRCRSSRRLSRNEQRPRPRRVSCRAGGVGTPAPVAPCNAHHPNGIQPAQEHFCPKWCLRRYAGLWRIGAGTQGADCRAAILGLRIGGIHLIRDTRRDIEAAGRFLIRANQKLFLLWNFACHRGLRFL